MLWGDAGVVVAGWGGAGAVRFMFYVHDVLST